MRSVSSGYPAIFPSSSYSSLSLSLLEHKKVQYRSTGSSILRQMIWGFLVQTEVLNTSGSPHSALSVLSSKPTKMKSLHSFCRWASVHFHQSNSSSFRLKSSRCVLKLWTVDLNYQKPWPHSFFKRYWSITRDWTTFARWGRITHL